MPQQKFHFLSSAGWLPYVLLLLLSCKKDPQLLTEDRYYDVKYRESDLNTMDIRLPAARTGATKTVFFLHGGSWTGGDKKQMDTLASFFFERGFATVTVNYRLARSKVRYREINGDIGAAIHYFAAHAQEYEVSGSRLGIVGFSAGAQLGLLYTYQNDSTHLVKAVVSIACPSNLCNTFYSQGIIGPSIEAYTGDKYAVNPALWKINSPYYAADAGSVPTYLVHGTLDTYVDINDSRNLKNKLDALGIENILDEVPEKHGTIMFMPASKFRELADWMNYMIK